LFEREHHRRIAEVLSALDGPALSSLGCLFGGGTAMVLRNTAYPEYRESLDIDFIVSHPPGYRTLRAALTGPEGLRPFTRTGFALKLAREMRADQYGVRALLEVDGALVKFEIVYEARITLQAPQASDHVLGVPSLTPLDMLTTKLLANADRWADDAVQSRDLIDLAMQAPSKAQVRAAVEKAQAAYGESVRRDLHKSVQALRARPGRLAARMQALGMDGVPRAWLWQRMVALGRAA
jgi:Nucleotidyl transferase AbiEii toxin, Type IV TA system